MRGVFIYQLRIKVMARLIQHLQNTDAPSSDYPYGRVRDNTGSGNGTPANEKALGDIHQFFAKLMDEAGISANGLPDNDYSGFQLYEALDKFWRIARVENSDINNVTETGFYISVEPAANRPGNAEGCMVHINRSSEIANQFFMRNFADQVFFRRKEGGVWQPWVELANKSQVVQVDGSQQLLTKVIEIGDWNMDSDSSMDVAHGLSLSKIRSVHGVIRNDGDSLYTPIPYMDISLGGSDTDLTINSITASVITLLRKAGGVFDNTSYDQTGYNRGWLTIYHVD